MSEVEHPKLTLSASPVLAFVGPFGSGKTELSINYALAAVDGGRGTCLVDLDVVTPYFRVGDYREQLAARGLEVIAPEGARAKFETPSLPPEIAGALTRGDLHVVLDVGGDPVGARLLGVYAEQLHGGGCEVWMVVNPFRPSASTPRAVAEQARAIEESSRLRVSALIANPHLGPATEPADVEAGLEQVCQAAEQLGRPVVGLAVERSLLRRLSPLAVTVLPLSLMVRPPWDPGAGVQERSGP